MSLLLSSLCSPLTVIGNYIAYAPVVATRQGGGYRWNNFRSAVLSKMFSFYIYLHLGVRRVIWLGSTCTHQWVKSWLFMVRISKSSQLSTTVVLLELYFYPSVHRSCYVCVCSGEEGNRDGFACVYVCQQGCVCVGMAVCVCVSVCMAVCVCECEGYGVVVCMNWCVCVFPRKSSLIFQILVLLSLDRYSA